METVTGSSSSRGKDAVLSYFGKVAIGSELQQKVMSTFAKAFDLTHLPDAKRPSDAELLEEIRNAHNVETLFSVDVIRNSDLIKIARDNLVRLDILPDPPVHLNERVMIKLAHILYPGEKFKNEREKAVSLCKSFLSGSFDLGTTTRDGAILGSDSAQQATHSPVHPLLLKQEIPSNLNADQLPMIGQGMYAMPNMFVPQTSGSMYMQMAQMQAQLAHLMNFIPQGALSPQSVTNSQDAMSAMGSGIQPVANNQRVTAGAHEIPQSSSRGAINRGTAPDGHFNPAMRSEFGNRRGQDGGNVHHQISLRFKNKESKYSGIDTEIFSDFLSDYATVSEDYGLSATQKLKYFHNLFRGSALRYFNTNVKGRSSTFAEAVTAIRSHFNSEDAQQRVKASLSSLSFQSFVDKEGSKSKGLRALADHISSRITECPQYIRNEASMVDFLRSAVIGEDWATRTLEGVNSSTEFQNFYSMLANALQIHTEKELLHGKQGQSGTPVNSSKPMIFFAQPQYAKKMAKALFPGNEKDTSCWNCGRSGHRFTKCHRELDMAVIAANKADYFEKKNSNRRDSARSTKQVLFELAEGMNSLCKLGNSSSFDNSQVKAFFGDVIDCDESSSDSSDYECSNAQTIGKNPNAFVNFTDSGKHTQDSSDSSGNEDF